MTARAALRPARGPDLRRRPVANPWIERWADDEYIRVGIGRTMDHLAAQGPAGHRLVGDDEHLLAPVGGARRPVHTAGSLVFGSDFM